MVNNRTLIIIVPSVTIISLVLIAFLVPNINRESCTEIEATAIKFKQCPSGVTSNITQVVTNNLPVPVSIPGNVSELNEIFESEMAENVTARPLNTIVGNWLVSGNNSQQQQFAASFTFQSNNQYSSILNINGSLSPFIFGKYNFSPTQEIFTLRPYGGGTDVYKIIETTSDSFKVSGISGTMSFQRVLPRT